MLSTPVLAPFLQPLQLCRAILFWLPLWHLAQPRFSTPDMLNGTVAVTDFRWYEFLAKRSLPEVNFWTPSDRRRFDAPQFSPVFFKLKAPHRAIAGFGYFAARSSLPEWLAWECFGEGNGCESLRALEARLAEIRTRIHTPRRAPSPASAAS